MFDGPAWVQPPTLVDPDLFGVTINSATGAMPNFRVNGVRLWDSASRWSLIEPQRGTYDWSVLDRLVAGAEGNGLPVLYTFGGTPRWASPEGPASPYEEGARASAPDDLADWDTFVQQVATRYTGRISAYELWNLAPSDMFFTGSPDQLADMTRRASTIIRAVDPKATVVCPGIGKLWDEAPQQFLIDFAAAGGYDYCDAAAIKLYPKEAGDPMESMVELGKIIDSTFHRAGVKLPVWNTGTKYEIATDKPLNEADAENAAVRFFLVGLYLRYQRMYFYSWGGTKLPIVLQPVGGTPTRAALYVEELQRWLRDARIFECGSGPANGLPEQAWQCRFILPDEQGGTRSAAIRWMQSGRATMTLESGALQVRRLDGSRANVREGDALELTEQPILVDFGPA